MRLACFTLVLRRDILSHLLPLFLVLTQSIKRMVLMAESSSADCLQVYWYNHHTSAGQWEKPEEVARLQLAASRNEGSSRVSE